MATPDEIPVLSFATQKQWEAWLAKQTSTSPGVWLRLFKKGRETKAIDYETALQGALCYGWIDSQKRTYDADSWIQKFTRRRPKGAWSKLNIERVERLIAEKRMKADGLREVETAKTDGRWDRAYDSAKTMSFPNDFLARLQKNKKAKKFFDTLNRTNLYAVAYRLQTAKTASTRERRMDAIFEKLENGETWH